MDDEDILNTPGGYAAQSASGYALPQDDFGSFLGGDGGGDVPNLPSIGDLASSPVLSLPSSYDIPDAYSPSAAAGLGSAVFTPATQQSSGGFNLNDLGTIFGALLGDGQAAYNAFVITPQNIANQTAQAQNAAAAQANSVALDTSSLTTVLLWAAIAFGAVVLFEDVGKKL